ncbi:hypothetical protein U9M48_043560 [Paspalum notatum var. saurae]|uniref:Uncharacterized protein n=1 Tax=Paspalum notatum var. saurae TaxID=547442 RepID=A0AAQ3XHH5_PASNO
MVVPSGGGGGDRGAEGGGSAAGPRVKGSWTPEEDERLRRAVARHGARNWSVISGEVPGRSGKSCRLRWCNQLSPGVERRAFTPEEDALIVAAHAEFGNKWATIARLLHGRTDNSVKNHWNSTLRRQRRAAAASANAAGGVGCASPVVPVPLAAAVRGSCGGAAPLRHLLRDDPVLPPCREREPEEDEDMEEEEEDDDDEEDGSSGDSVLAPPPKKRPCLSAVQQHPNYCHLLAAKPPELARPPPPEPLTSLTLSLPGGGGGGPETPQSAAPPSLVEESAAAKMKMEMKAKLEQDPWFVPVMRQMICEEVHRQMQQGRIVAAPAPACRSGGADDDAAANGQQD